MVFGKKPQPKPGYYAAPPAPKPAGPDMNTVSHDLEVRVSDLEQKIRKCDVDLLHYKKELAGQKPGTASHNITKQRFYRVSKQKQMLSKQMDGMLSQQMNIDAVRMMGEQMQAAQDTIAIMEQTKKANMGMKTVDLDKAADLQDDIEEMLNEANYITETLGRNYAVDGIDDAELEAEIDGLEEELYFGTATVPQFQPVQTPGQQVPAANYSQPSKTEADPRLRQ